MMRRETLDGAYFSGGIISFTRLRTATNLDCTATNLDRTATNLDRTATNLDRNATNLDQSTNKRFSIITSADG